MKNPQFAQTLRELFPIPLPFVVSKAMDGINTTTKIRRLMNRYGLTRSRTNLSYELVTLAHQLEDMFTGCFWLGQEVRMVSFNKQETLRQCYINVQPTSWTIG